MKADNAKKNDGMNDEVDFPAHYRKVTGTDKNNMNGYYQDHHQASKPHSMTDLHLRRIFH